MDKIKGFLVEWTVNLLKNKDIIAKKIKDIKTDTEGFDVKVTYTDKTQLFLVTMKLWDMNSILKKLKDENGYYGIVTFNMKENIDVLVKNWNQLVKFKFLSVYFVNPWSNTDKKWIIYPYTHNRISDPASLIQGLDSMSQMVEFLTEEQVKSKIQ